MDYWRRYEADYLADTLELSMLEDGAYGRMLGYCYSKEKPLPPELDRIYTIARANKPQEQAAVRTVLAAYFTLEDDGYHNARADRELAVAVPKIEKLREVARQNGKKGGNPQKKADYHEPGTLYAFRFDRERVKIGITKYPAQRVSALRGKNKGKGELVMAVTVVDMGNAEASILSEFSGFADGEVLVGLDQGSAEETRLFTMMRGIGKTTHHPNPEAKTGEDTHPDTHPVPRPDTHPALSQPLSAIRQPENLNPRFPGDGGTTTQKPPPTADGREQNLHPDALARILLECKRARVEDAAEDSPVIARWIRKGATPTQVSKALTEARAPGSKPLPQELRIGYVDAILERVMRQDGEAAAATEARFRRTQEVIAEGIEAKARAVQKPENFPAVKRA